jgi:hypothetical protein
MTTPSQANAYSTPVKYYIIGSLCLLTTRQILVFVSGIAVALGGFPLPQVLGAFLGAMVMLLGIVLAIVGIAQGKRWGKYMAITVYSLYLFSSITGMGGLILSMRLASNVQLPDGYSVVPTPIGLNLAFGLLGLITAGISLVGIILLLRPRKNEHSES